MNNVCLVGRAVEDAVLRATQTGKDIIFLTIAVTRETKNADGKYDSDFIGIKIWGELAKTVSKYVKKGNRISVVGKIESYNQYNERTQHNETKLVVVAKSVRFMENKPKTETQQPIAQPQPTVEEKDAFQEFGEQVSISDADLPFDWN